MIPEVEWWDGPFVLSQDMLIEQDAEFEAQLQKSVSNLIEHPVQLAAPSKYNDNLEYATKRSYSFIG